MARSLAPAAGALLVLAAAAWWLVGPQAVRPPSQPPAGPFPENAPLETAPPLLGPAGTSPSWETRQTEWNALWLTGWVLAAPEGQPLAGARLEAEAAASGLGQQAQSASWPTAATAPDGSFRLGPLPAGALLLRVRAEGRAGWARLLTAHDLREPLSIFLEPGRSLAGLVLDATTGAPLTGARVLAGLPVEGLEARVDSQGRFFLEGLPRDRALRLLALAPTHEARELEHGPGDPQPRILLAPKPLLRIRLLHPAHGSPDQAPPRILVTATGAREEEDALAGPYGSFAGREWQKELPWPEGGELCLQEFDPGWLGLRVETRDEPMLVGEIRPFRLEPGQTLDLHLDLLPAPILQGEVRDQRGAPLAGVEVWAAGGGPRVRTDTKGRFSLVPAPQAPGLLVARLPGVAALTLDLTGWRPGAGGELGSLVLPDRTGRVTGVVTDPEGRVQAGALVVLSAPGLPPGEWFTRTGREGTFDLAGLPWGSWRLFLWPKGSSPPLSFAKSSPRLQLELTPERPSADLSLMLEK